MIIFCSEFLDVASIFPEQLKKGTVIDIGEDDIVTVEMFPHGKNKPYTQKIEGKYLLSEITPLQKGSIVKAPRKFDVIHKKVSC